MAIMDDFPGIEVTAQVDGVALKEYEDRDEEEPKNTQMRYVESVSGKDFAINLEVEEGFKYKGDSLTFHIFADGVKAHGRTLRPQVRRGLIQGFDSGAQIKKFRFNAIETVCDSRTTKQAPWKIQNLGTLEVRVHHTKRTGEPSLPLPSSDYSQVGVVSEKALKGQTVSYSIGTGNSVTKPATMSNCMVTYLDGLFNPTATFIFRYRSMAALKSMLISPRTPTPPPLEERDFDSLSREELMELHRRAKEAKELEDKKRKIKRERTDDNPRLRKVSRPSAGDTQLEIDDNGSVWESSVATVGRDEREVIELD